MDALSAPALAVVDEEETVVAATVADVAHAVDEVDEVDVQMVPLHPISASTTRLPSHRCLNRLPSQENQNSSTLLRVRVYSPAPIAYEVHTRSCVLLFPSSYYPARVLLDNFFRLYVLCFIIPLSLSACFAFHSRERRFVVFKSCCRNSRVVGRVVYICIEQNDFKCHKFTMPIQCTVPE